METIIDLNDSILEFWQPSVQLRWVEKEVCVTCRTEKVLQQLHTSNLGNNEWRDVPLEEN